VSALWLPSQKCPVFVVDKGATVPFGEAEHGRCADLVREDVGAEPVHHLFPVCSRILCGSICRHNASDCLAEDLSVGREVIGRVPGIETVAEAADSTDLAASRNWCRTFGWPSRESELVASALQTN
jgi:hypothetical protein